MGSSTNKWQRSRSQLSYKRQTAYGLRARKSQLRATVRSNWLGRADCKLPMQRSWMTEVAQAVARHRGQQEKPVG